MSTKTYGGRLKFFGHIWSKFTQDKLILSWIKGYKIPFIKFPIQTNICSTKVSKTDLKNYSAAIFRLCQKGVITECSPVKNQFLSSFFLIPKADKSYRFILNLKKLNEYIVPPHFKLDNYKSVKDLISKNVYMATLDLKDAYYMVPIDPDHKKYIRFQFQDKLYEFNCLPMGLATAPYMFTKLLKPIFRFFRQQGILCLIYLDDILVLGRSIEEVQCNINVILETLQSLGFMINTKKSQLRPSQTCQYLGFIYNSADMRMHLPPLKKQSILQAIKRFLALKICTIRELAKIIGLLISACPAVTYGWFHTKLLERQKYLSLRRSSGNYSTVISVSRRIRTELHWWLGNIKYSFSSLNCPNYKFEIFSDASKTGWGATCKNAITRGFWNNTERQYHINYLELLAVFYALQCFACGVRNCAVLLRVDNKTAIAYINKMGGVMYQNLNNLSREIWSWCEKRNILVYASYIPSKENTIADEQSRILRVESEYTLHSSIYSDIISCFGRPSIDLFASRVNKKCKIYVSWLKDPGALTSDAFTLKWEKSLFFYAFPPFPLIGRILKKIIEDRSIGILVVPYWPNSSWFSLFLRLCSQKPIIFEPSKQLLLSPFRKPHPLWRNIRLVASKLSGELF